MSMATRAEHSFVERKLDLALSEAPRSGAARKLAGKEERRRRCGWRRPARSTRPDAPAGPSHCCATEWFGLPSNKASCAMPCAGALARTYSSHGERT